MSYFLKSIFQKNMKSHNTFINLTTEIETYMNESEPVF